MDKSETQKYVSQLQTDNQELKHTIEKEQEHIDCLKAELAEFQNNAYQDQCVTINNLNVTIDTLVDKLARLRSQKGL